MKWCTNDIYYPQLPADGIVTFIIGMPRLLYSLSALLQFLDDLDDIFVLDPVVDANLLRLVLG